jgi:hypothetical protein
MSGKHTDILDLIKESSHTQAEKVLTLMSSHRPHIQIDRDFRARLKNEIIGKSKKTFWDFRNFLSPLSLLATCFLFFFIFWKGNTYPIEKPTQMKRVTVTGESSNQNNLGIIKTTLEEIQKEKQETPKRIELSNEISSIESDINAIIQETSEKKTPSLEKKIFSPEKMQIDTDTISLQQSPIMGTSPVAVLER